MPPTNDVDFTCNSTSDIGTCFRQLAVPFHIQNHSRVICIYSCIYMKDTAFNLLLLCVLSQGLTEFMYVSGFSLLSKNESRNSLLYPVHSDYVQVG
jgi:hypothetical protein